MVKDALESWPLVPVEEREERILAITDRLPEVARDRFRVVMAGRETEPSEGFNSDRIIYLLTASEVEWREAAGEPLLGLINTDEAERISEEFDQDPSEDEDRQLLKEHLAVRAWKAFDKKLSATGWKDEKREIWMSRKAQAIRESLRPKISLDSAQARILASTTKTIRVTARAGSGKTRLLKALSYFLVSQCGYAPEEILLLAFNKDAAGQLETGLIDLLGLPAFPGARTFHSLAYGIAQPEEALVKDQGEEIGAMELTALVQDILSAGLDDATREEIYELFRAEAEIDKRTGALLEGESHYAFRRTLAQVTLSGKTVKSKGEKYIDDFLFEHGVKDYYYEDPIWWDGGLYRPDFKIKTGEKSAVFLEHWAVDPDSKVVVGSREWPEAKQRKYQINAREKREFWKKKGTTLIETCARECGDREVFENVLRERLAPHLGILRRRPLPDLIKSVAKIHLSLLAKSLSQGIQRAQKRGWEYEDLKLELADYMPKTDREKLFLRLLLQVFREYAPTLKHRRKTDFDRLFNRAVALMQQELPRTNVGGKQTSIDLRKIRICLVDEAQDLSPQFVQALECFRAFNPSLRLFFVGDDWQAINRFAGSSVELFNQGITERFGKCYTTPLAANYRSNPQIVSAGNALMEGLGEPAVPHRTGIGQIERVYYDKVWVESNENEPGYQFDAVFRSRAGAEKIVKALYQVVLPELRRGRTVGVLFRKHKWFGMDHQELRTVLIQAFRKLGWPSALVDTWNDNLTFSTAHKFKGAESQTIIIMGPHDGNFPLIHASSIELFSFFGDTLEQAGEDERRLFYVALTRAKERLVLFCESKLVDESSFLEPIKNMISDISLPKEVLMPEMQFNPGA